MKRCPFCAESINDEAIKCRYCQSELRGGEEENATTACAYCGREAGGPRATRCQSCGQVIRGSVGGALPRLAVAFVVAAALVAAVAALVGQIVPRATPVAIVGAEDAGAGAEREEGSNHRGTETRRSEEKKSSNRKEEAGADAGSDGEKAPRPVIPAPRPDDVVPRVMKKHAPT